jgi:hypothetical protein
MAGYDPKGKRARSNEATAEGDTQVDAILNATGEHAAVRVEPTPTPPEGVAVTAIADDELPDAANRDGKRHTEDTPAVVAEEVAVEPLDESAVADPDDPTPPEAPLPDDEALPTAPERREPLVSAAPPPDEDDRRLVIAAIVALIVALITGGLIAWRRRAR